MVHGKSQDSQDWEKQFQEREQALRLRELEIEVMQGSSTSPLAESTPTVKLEAQPKVSQVRRWMRRTGNIIKFLAFFVVMAAVVKLGYWLAMAIVIGVGGWLGYKAFIERDPES